jgi:magnesium chelatase family protein
LDEAPRVLAARARRAAPAAGERLGSRSPASADRRLPAAFTLLLAANYCPCARPEDCSCAPDVRRRYLSRLSGPLLDRVDMHIEVPRITRAEMLAEDGRGESSRAIAARVAAARAAAAARLAGTPWRTNGDVPPVELRRRWPLPRRATAPADDAMDRGQLTARGYGRVLRLAWTLADLDAAGPPGEPHVAHALGFRLGSVQGLAA